MMRNSWIVRKSWIVLALVVAGVSFGIGSASAIEFGQPDGNKHPWVGLVVFYDADDKPIQRCTGSLLSPTKFLTAGHCAGVDATAGSPKPELARIWFDEGPIPCDPNYAGGDCSARLSCDVDPSPYTGYPCAGYDAIGNPVPHPNWSGLPTTPQTWDVGVVDITSAPLPGPYGRLASVGFLDTLATKRGQKDTGFTIVGYGVQSVKPVFVAIPQRMRATVNLVNLRSALVDVAGVQVSGNPGHGNGAGAICYGDSGGPLLYDTGAGEVIVAVNSFVYSKNCTGPSAGYRVDTADAQSFIGLPR